MSETCHSCASTSFIMIATHSKDCHWAIVEKDGKRLATHDGYSPAAPVLGTRGGGDDMTFTICLKCGHCQQFKGETTAEEAAQQFQKARNARLNGDRGGYWCEESMPPTDWD
eukprot:TRINITY_DN13574_c0_g1_i1.p1 TRINITY_DN13574_c0_g1~~TRINITY_DN13574_c0_g1_i1.p1  ORF type:complete len:112 (+),score=6.56 TRINITY_DN13574_c0_g1_i1:94-429(+)